MLTQVIKDFILNYGYIVLFFGAFFEGETFLIIAGFLVHQGYMFLPLVIFVSMLGAIAGDQFYFSLGRIGGRRILKKYPSIHIHIKRIHYFIKKYENLFYVGFRFMYGIRTITPIILGAEKTKRKKFFIFNIIGSLAWAVIFVFLGYFLGEAARTFFGKLKHIEILIIFWIAIIGIVLGTILVLYEDWKDRRKTNSR